MTEPTDRIFAVGYQDDGTIVRRLQCLAMDLETNEALAPGLSWLEYDPAEVRPGFTTHCVSDGAIVPIS